jgi:hypothetical protein
MMSVARDVDVPEPSPLFWDHLVVARIGCGCGGVRSAPARAVARFSDVVRIAHSSSGRRLAASLLIVVRISGRTPSPAGADAPGIPIGDTTPDPLGVATDDDDSLTLVASLTDGQDLETVREAGLAPRGSAEHALTHMTDGELRELRRLLKEELARPGA